MTFLFFEIHHVISLSTDNRFGLCGCHVQLYATLYVILTASIASQFRELDSYIPVSSILLGIFMIKAVCAVNSGITLVAIVFINFNLLTLWRPCV